MKYYILYILIAYVNYTFAQHQSVPHPSSYDELTSSANNYLKKKNYPKALPIIRILTKKAKLEKKDSIYLEWTKVHAQIQYKMGEYEKAISLAFQLSDVQEKIYGKESIIFSTTLLNIANMCLATKNYDEALSLCNKVSHIQEKRLKPISSIQSRIYSLRAKVYTQKGNYEQALILLTRVQTIITETTNSPKQLLSCLISIAKLHKKMGNYQEAIRSYNHILEQPEKLLNKNQLQFTKILNDLSSTYQQIGIYDKAIALSIRSKQIQEQVIGSNHPSFANSLNNLAALYLLTEQYQKALPLFMQALRIAPPLKSKRTNTLVYLNNIANLYIKTKKYDKAWEYLNTATKANTLSNTTIEITPLWTNSIVQADYYSNKHIEKMLKSLEHLIQLVEKDSSIQNVLPKKILLIDAAMSLLNKLKNRISGEKDKLRILKQSNLWLLKSLEILHPSQHASKAFKLADQHKSVLLLESITSKKDYHLGNLPDSLVKQEAILLSNQLQLQAKLLENRSPQEKKKLQLQLITINQKIEDFQSTVKTNFPKFHDLKYKDKSTNAEEIQLLLPPQTAMLEYVLSDSTVHIFYIDKDTIQWEKIPINQKDLSSQINTLYHALSNYRMIVNDEKKAYQDYVNSAQWLYSKLLDPVLKKKQINNLIIIPDGALGHLPFEVFLSKKEKQESKSYNQLSYLLREYTISYNYSATFWKENIKMPPPINNKKILGVATNYSIKIDSSKGVQRLSSDQKLREHLSPLPNARDEVNGLQNKFQGEFLFDLLASEKLIKEKVSQYAILHVAAHSILDNKNPLLSSLALTEDSDSIESNFWQAHEISKTQINANLVVLSACETGYGRFETGNGIASLARAFTYAGAPSVVVSLWQVNDHSTAVIMENFYNNLALGMPKDKALQQSKLQYINAAQGIASHPAFWSPFIIMGKTNAISIQQNHNYLRWGIGLFTLGIFFFLVKKLLNNRD